MKTFIVDSFTDTAFKGNPAGVCIVEDDLDDIRMYSIAKEFNFSETAFIRATADTHRYSIRFFSPKMEIPLCGHATLASAKVLFEQKTIETVTFINIENLELQARKIDDQIEMEFPVYMTLPASTSKKLLEGLGIGTIVNSEYNKETNILLIEISDADELKGLSPNFELLLKLDTHLNGVLITAPSKRPFCDFESRYFWPWSGTNEDPVTGGTHTFLAKYWGDRMGKNKLQSFQCSERTGFMEVEIVDNQKVFIRSNAVIVLEGEWIN